MSQLGHDWIFIKELVILNNEAIFLIWKLKMNTNHKKNLKILKK